ncbi:MAG TPA: flavodoxin family protein [Ruminiclostridium sp.]|nr:flavodoxin family protein [Ruminiclostridium sp.]
MKVIGISGSSRKDGNTAIIMKLVLAEMEKRGIESELIQLYDKEIVPCKGCFACKGNRNCVFKNDYFFDCFKKMVSADAILLGSPVYSADVTAKMKAFLERAGAVAATNSEMLKYKVGASVCAVRRGGGMFAVDAMNHFLLNKEVIIAGSTYWNMVYGKNVGDVLNDTEGVNNMKNLGQNMAWLLKQLHR